MIRDIILSLYKYLFFDIVIYLQVYQILEMIFFIIKKMQEKKKISIENRSLHRGRYKFIELSRGE